MGDKLYTFSFKKGFKRARKRDGYTQKTFSEEFGICLETVKNWEQGRNVPEIKMLEKLCNFFHCDMDYLLGLDECPTKTIQFIHDYTGLSTKAINQLNFLSHFPEPNLRNNVVCLNDLIEHNSFSVSLLQNIVKFFFQYWDYKKGEQLYEDEKKRKPQTSDICEEIKLKQSGYEPLITNKQLEELAEKKDITLFHITTDFSNLIKELAKYHDSKSKEKTPNSKRH